MLVGGVIEAIGARGWRDKRDGHAEGDGERRTMSGVLHDELLRILPDGAIMVVASMNAGVTA
ncbi:UNVERIFIED_ORG: hypothetical protein J2Y81_006118 [Paraburkholderia sediminicola]|nr:hypothetical protein [Paraburkholderia sediminicola]